MTIATTGNVGIGTTAPAAKLHVVGNAIFGQNTAQATATPVNVSFGGTYGTNTPGNKGNLKWDLYSDGIDRSGIGISTGLIEFQGGVNAGFGFYPNNGTTSALHIIPSGNVGIGTTAPSSKLHVAGTIKPEQATMVDKAAGFTLAAGDAGTIINSTSATAITINLPAADTATGYNVMIIQSGAGAVTIAANGNTLNSFGGAVITAGQHAACSIVRTAASTYNLSGNLV
jgi:hypothetical protein